MKLRIIIFGLLFIFFPIAVYPASLDEAVKQTAKYFSTTLAASRTNKQIIIQVYNYQSNQPDNTAKEIETKLYFALENRFANYKLVLLSDSLTGISSTNSIFIKGSYEQRGDNITLRFQALKGLVAGEILAQIETEYQTKQKPDRTLVAVLDIEALSLGPERRKAFSEIFRSALNIAIRIKLANNRNGGTSFYNHSLLSCLDPP